VNGPSKKRQYHGLRGPACRRSARRVPVRQPGCFRAPSVADCPAHHGQALIPSRSVPSLPLPSFFDGGRPPTAASPLRRCFFSKHAYRCAAPLRKFVSPQLGKLPSVSSDLVSSLHAASWPSQLSRFAGRLSVFQLGIVIPGSRIPGLAKPKSRDFGIDKNCIFSGNQHIFHDIGYKLEKKLFSHTLTVTLLSTTATTLQVATDVFHS